MHAPISKSDTQRHLARIRELATQVKSLQAPQHAAPPGGERPGPDRERRLQPSFGPYDGDVRRQLDPHDVPGSIASPPE